nr:tyrosine-protein phosphatase [Lachnospiraceae bacterium]
MGTILLKYDKLHNIRDLGGIKAAGGQSIRPGKLIRCGHLSELSDKDKGDLISLVDTIIDLRSYSEYNKQP